MRLKDKVAVVTGAAGGMGVEVVQTFLREGAKVVAADLHTEALALLSQSDSKSLISISTDVTNEKMVHRLVEQAIHHFGQTDILLNVAGVAQAATPTEAVTMDEWNRIMTVNVTAPFLTCKAVIPAMKKQNGGVIINVGSIAAERPRPGLSAYIASKGAVVAFTKSLALELAPYDIRANVINPGPADTNMLGKFAAAGVDAGQTKEKTFKNSVPLGRLIKPKDVAAAAVYLCSDEARNVTGAVFNIDGGRGL